MDGFAAVDFGFAHEVVQRGIAALYVVAFVSTLNQFRPLLGEHGLLPATDFLAWARSSARGRKLLRPTIFRSLGYTDRRLVALCWSGIVIAAALVAGIPQLAPPWVPMLCFLALYIGYLSITSIGQTFYGFGWEMLLVEAGFLAAFLGSDDQPPASGVIVLTWWLVFRLEFGAGMIKIRGGREWRDLTALMYHHETQPMPGPLSRQAHLLPKWFHRGEVLGNHFAQLIVPWFLFAPLLQLVVPWAGLAWIGAIAAAVIIGTQLWLIVTGNFAWLNWITVVLAFSGLGIPGVGAAHATAATAPPWLVNGIPLYWIVITSAVTVGYVVLSWPAARNLAARRQLMNASFNNWQLGNAYGAFGTVTKERIEIVIEGSMSDDPDAGDWVEYDFKGKPGELRRIPRQYAPYHLRLDWLMWFLPLGRSLDDWFTALLVRLLEADPATLRLLRRDPFAGDRPTWVRAVSYRYRFTTHAEFRGTRARWKRDRFRPVLGPLRLRGTSSASSSTARGR